MERTRKNRQFPSHPLQRALVVVEAIPDQGAGRPMDRVLLAKALGRTPSSSEFRVLLSSSYKYGLTEGTEKSDYITPTPLGLRIVKPTDERERQAALVDAALRPELLSNFYRQYNRSKIPSPEFLRNILERTFHVDPDHIDELARLLIENARFVGLLEDVSGSQYIRIEDGPSKQTHALQSSEPPDSAAATPPASGVPTALRQSPPAAPIANKIFIAHGKKHGALNELKRLLDRFKIPYVVAVDEPNAGRPVSQKVADLMSECTAGIFVFTKDEKFRDGKDNEIWRPSENVVYELGAASIKWGSKIIILRETGVNFPSDFSDLGYIKFDEGALSSKTLELLQELVNFGLVKLQAA